MKKSSLCVVLIIASIILSGCSQANITAPEVTEAPTPVITEAPKVTIPDIAGIELSDAKNVLSSMGFIPAVSEEYNETVGKGLVINTKPAIGSEVSPNSKVTVRMSKGPKKVTSKSSYMHWTYVGRGKDEWVFYSPYIENKILYINCHSVLFGTAFDWKDRYSEGHGGGFASVNDTFAKVVPCEVKYSTQHVDAGKSTGFVISVPLTEITQDRPTDMYFRFGIIVNGVERELLCDVSMTW